MRKRKLRQSGYQKNRSKPQIHLGSYSSGVALKSVLFVFVDVPEKLAEYVPPFPLASSWFS
jgi:hypothetical protein